MNSLIPSNLNDETLRYIEREAKDFALTNGIAFRNRNSETGDHCTLAPITLFPSPFSRIHFNTAKRIQPLINRLFYKLAYDPKFIDESLEKVITADDFTAKLYSIYESVRKEGSAQTTSLGLLRSDYMMNQELNGEFGIKQVEVNTIAAGFVVLAPRMQLFHKYIMSKYSHINNIDSHLPRNDATQLMADGLIKSWEIYNHPDAVILFVVEQRIINLFDQRLFQFTIEQMRPDIKVIRRSFKELRNNMRIIGNRQLIVDNTHEIAVIYFRTGYAPNDFHGDDDWDLRLMMERSLAIKCPSIEYHLVGTKKIQQILSDVRVLEKYIPNDKNLNAVMETFTGMWGLEFGKDGDDAIEMALKDPEKYVLKPQREGGGNNYYGMEVKEKLSEIKFTSEREAYILMEYIRSPHVENFVLMPDKSIYKTQPINVVSELGIFGTIIGNKNEIIHNYDAGHLLRSKSADANEGGVSSGTGAIDSPFLV